MLSLVNLMSTPLADERLVSHSGSPNRSHNLKELQLSTDSTLSRSGTNNSSNQETESDGDNRKENNNGSQRVPQRTKRSCQI